MPIESTDPLRRDFYFLTFLLSSIDDALDPFLTGFLMVFLSTTGVSSSSDSSDWGFLVALTLFWGTFFFFEAARLATY